MKPADLAIVIPVHNRRAFTEACLAALGRQTVVGFQPVVVDDGSTDGTSELIRECFPSTVVLRGDGNWWWTKSTNEGVHYSLGQGFRYIMTLNDDTVPAEDFIEKMIYWASRNPTALLGAFGVDVSSGAPSYGGELVRWYSASTVSLLEVVNEGLGQGLHRVTHFPGRGLLIPAEVFGRIGLFDMKHFPHYLADYDFTHRARRAGYQLYCNYDAVLGVYPAASGSVEALKEKSFHGYLNHLSGMKGAGNLKTFWSFAIRNCPKRWLLLYLPLGFGRRIFGYLIEWAREACSPPRVTQ